MELGQSTRTQVRWRVVDRDGNVVDPVFDDEAPWSEGNAYYTLRDVQDEGTNGPYRVERCVATITTEMTEWEEAELPPHKPYWEAQA